ncbi:unnamed protein product [Chrysoparadoxa australica]
MAKRGAGSGLGPRVRLLLGFCIAITLYHLVFNVWLVPPCPERNESVMGIMVPNGMQQGLTQIEDVVNSLFPGGQQQADKNLLIWGVGHDSVFWQEINAYGRTVFLEDNIEWLEAVREAHPELEIYKVEFTTKLATSVERYGYTTDHWKELNMSDQLPSSVTDERWDVIMVDGPAGIRGHHPGRAQSIYMSRKLATGGGHVFVDDCDRKAERVLGAGMLGIDAGSLISKLHRPRRGPGCKALKNDQCHFAIHPTWNTDR